MYPHDAELKAIATVYEITRLNELKHIVIYNRTQRNKDT